MSTAEKFVYRFVKLEERVDRLVEKQIIQGILVALALIFVLPYAKSWFGHWTIGNIIYGCFLLFLVGLAFYVASWLIALFFQLLVTFIAAPFEAVYAHEVKKRKEEENRQAIVKAREEREKRKAFDEQKRKEAHDRRLEMERKIKEREEEAYQKNLQIEEELKREKEEKEKREREERNAQEAKEKRKEKEKMEETIKKIKIMDPIDLACEKGSENVDDISSLYQFYWLDDDE